MDNIFQRRILGALNMAANVPALVSPTSVSRGHIYAGTVPAATIEKRRKANKAARKARRAAR